MARGSVEVPYTMHPLNGGGGIVEQKEKIRLVVLIAEVAVLKRLNFLKYN